jgi:hypothetical protein
MKKVIYLMVLLAVFTLSSSVFSQPYKNVEFGEVTFSIPNNWVTSEHILLLLMPENELLQFEAEFLNKIDLNQIVMETIEKMKIEFPVDTNIIRRDFKIDKINAIELTLKTSDGKIINYIFVETPKKTLKIYGNIPEEEFKKNKADIEYIKENIKIKK